MNKGYRLGGRLRRLWYKVQYFLNGEGRQAKRERKAWAKLAKKHLRQRLAEDMRTIWTIQERRERLAEQVAVAVREGYLQEERPYKGCMTDEHYDVIMRSRVVQLNVEDRTIYEVNTKGMEDWEIEEFWHMLRARCRFHRQRPVIREVISDRFPQ